MPVLASRVDRLDKQLFDHQGSRRHRRAQAYLHIFDLLFDRESGDPGQQDLVVWADFAVIHADLAAPVAITVADQQGYRQIGQPRQLQPGGDVVFGYTSFVGRDQQAGGIDDAQWHRADQLVVGVGHCAVPKLIAVVSIRWATNYRQGDSSKLCARPPLAVTRLAVPVAQASCSGWRVTEAVLRLAGGSGMITWLCALACCSQRFSPSPNSPLGSHRP